MAITTQERTNILKLTVGLFNAAPGANYLSEFTSVFEANGHNLAALAGTLGTTGAFQSLYPNFQTASEFATKFLTTLGLQGNTEAVDFVTAKFNAGVPKAQIIHDAVVALDASTSAEFAAAKAILVNKAAVAENYSVTLGASSTSLAALQGALANVTADPASVTAANAANAGGNGQTFMLTTGTDTFVGGTGNDTFDAAVGLVLNGTTGLMVNTDTMQAVDVLKGGAGTDTLNFTTAGTVALPTLESIEIINAQSLAGLTINTSTVAGVTNLNVTKAAGAVIATAAATTDVGVSVKGITGNTVVVNGGKNVNVTTTDAVAAIDVGATGTDPVGTVTISATGAAAANANAAVTLGNITVGGGKTVSVTQKAASDASALVAGAGAVTHNQGDVTVVAAATTTGVTIKQDADVTAVNGAVAVAGVAPVATVKFGAMALNDTIVIGGLTFIAAKALTAAEAAAAFANLSKDFAPLTGDTQGSGIVANGVYTGAFTGWTTGAASGDTVLFTSTAAATAYAAVTAPANTGTPAAVASSLLTTTGVNVVTGVAAKLGVTAGVVDITGAAALKTVTVDGYDVTTTAGTNKIKGATNTVLDTINLSNGGGVTITSAASTLALNLEKVGGAIAFTTAPTTLNIKSIGNNTIGTLTAAATEALNVSGTGTLSAVTASDLTATKAIKVTETAGLNLTGATLTNLTSVDSTGTTGAVTITIDGTKTTYAGGAGKDTVTLATGTALTKAINLGAGDDTVVFGAAVTGSTAALNGGDGIDTLSMSSANADALDAAKQTFYTGFERLTVNDAFGTNDAIVDTLTLNLDNLGFTNYVTTSGTNQLGGAIDKLVLDKFASNGTVVLTATGDVTVNVTDAATGTADVLNAVLSSTGNLAAGTLTAANVETANISTVDTEVVVSPAVQTKNVDSLTLTADKATTVNVSGAADLTLTLTGSTKVTSIDGSTMTGGLTVTSLNTTAATTIKGGSGNDVLTAATGTTADVLVGGAGNDTLTGNAGLSTLTGGAGNDLFVLNVASLDVNSYATITDFAAGDLLNVTGVSAFKSAKVTLGDTAVFQDYANAAINTLLTTEAGWFQFGGNTYVVADIGAETTTFTNAQDFVIKLTGLVDLSNASFNNTSDTIALV